MLLLLWFAYTNQFSSIPFKHTGDDWIKITDNFGRWCWYRGVIAPPGSREMTVLADCSMFSSTEAWEVRIGTNIGCYGADGVKYSETRLVAIFQVNSQH